MNKGPSQFLKPEHHPRPSDIYPWEFIKKLDEAELGIFIAKLQKKWEREITIRAQLCGVYPKEWWNMVGCVCCGEKFNYYEEIPHDYFRYFGVPFHFRELERWMHVYEERLGEKDIRYLARIYGNVWSESTRGSYNSVEVRILNYFNLATE